MRKWTIGIGLLLAVWLVLACAIRSWQRGQFPSGIALFGPVVTEDAPGLREGCTAIVYRLPEESAARIAREGMGLLARLPPPRAEDPRNRYQPWHATPLAPEPHAFATGALNGCSGRAPPELERLADALGRPGSFYALTANGEGILVLAPGARLAAHLYWG